MKTYYFADKGLKMSEEDVFEKGCLPDTGSHCVCDMTFKAATKSEIIEEIKNFFGVNDDAIELDACDEPGRVDVAMMECEDGTLPSNDELAQWKEGKRRLWYVVYTFRVVKIVETVETLL